LTSKIRLRVPPRHRTAFDELAGLDDASRQEVVSVFARAREPLDRRMVADGLARIQGLQNADQLVDALVGLESTRASHYWDLKELSRSIASAPELEVSPENRSAFSGVVFELLSLPVLARAAKAGSLRSAHPRLLHTSRVLTDMRPVFEDEVGELPSGAIILQQLELEVYTSSGFDEIYLQASDDELERLRSQIDRALEKSRALASFVKKSGIPLYVEHEE
jgi:hypothetical protein